MQKDTPEELRGRHGILHYMKKTDVMFIHGGMTFKNKKDYKNYLAKYKGVYLDNTPRWDDDYLDTQLGNKFRVIRPSMPLKDNAQYDDWKIYFERFLPHLNKPFVLIGFSLGAIFLAKYLSENKLKHKARAVYMVAPPFDNTIEGEDLVGGFRLKSDLSLVMKNAQHVTLMFSEDDTCVPISHAEKYRKKLPDATFAIYKSKGGHFQTRTFPEIVKMIKKDVQ